MPSESIELNGLSNKTCRKRRNSRHLSTKVFCFCFGFLFGFVFSLLLLSYFQNFDQKFERNPKNIKHFPEVHDWSTTTSAPELSTNNVTEEDVLSTTERDFNQTELSANQSSTFFTQTDSYSSTTSSPQEVTQTTSITTLSLPETTPKIPDSHVISPELNVTTGAPSVATEAPSVTTGAPSVLNVTINDVFDVLNDSLNSTSVPKSEGNETLISTNQTTNETTVETTIASNATESSSREEKSEELCLSSQFLCPNSSSKSCLEKELICDGIPDCPEDGFDERKCRECGLNFRCGLPDNVTGSAWCISRRNYCDGLWDCPMGEDELGCHVTQCKKGEFLCQDRSACITGRQACDQHVDCPDHSDEIGCVNREMCAKSGKFFCADGLCLEAGLRCDGVRDCADDELNCESPKNCSQRNGFLCRNNACVESGRRCDGVDDCGDQSDELSCLSRDQRGVVLHFDAKADNYSVLCFEEKSFDANAICRAFGSFKALNWTAVRGVSRTTWFAFNQSQVSHSDICEQNTTALLSCDERSCGRSLRVEGNASLSSVSEVPLAYRLVDSGRGLECLCVLLSSHWLILSAQCQRKLSSDLTQLRLITPYEPTNNVTLKRVFAHFRFTRFRSLRVPDFDFALLETSSAVPEPALPVCLPNHAIDPEITCFVRTQDAEVSLHVLETSACNSSQHFNGRLTQRHFCAQHVSGRTCDVVARPLLCLSSASTWYVSGFVSFVYGCNESHVGGSRVGYRLVEHPVITSNVFSVKEWIEDWINGRKRVTEELFDESELS